MITGRHLILIIDDDEFMRDGTAAVLEAEGYEAIGARTGREALTLLRAGTVKPSLILLDFMMPGMTGGEFRAAQLQDATLATIPVVFVSALHSTLHVLQSGPLRAAAILEKPVQPRDLLAIVEQLCRDGVPAEAAAPRKLDVRDSITGRRFVVSCRHCKRLVAIVGGIADPDQLDQLRAHLRACSPGELDGSSPAIEATLRHFRIMPSEP